MGARIDLRVAEGVAAFLRGCGKVPVLVRNDRPGQMTNWNQQAMIRECVDIVQDGIATAEDVDPAVKTGRGFLDWTPEKAQEVRARRDAFLIQFLRSQKERRLS